MLTIFLLITGVIPIILSPCLLGGGVAMCLGRITKEDERLIYISITICFISFLLFMIGLNFI